MKGVAAERVLQCAAGKIIGDVRVSGHPKVQETFARVIGYVEQSDIHSAHVSPHAYPALLISCTVLGGVCLSGQSR